ncbi:MAG TPA: response regulator transcription factor [Baekduia sp.]|nr:response regulator transcription factor [Baekduia sp.]
MASPGSRTFEHGDAQAAAGASPRRPVTVLAVDDRPVFRRVVRDLIAATDGFAQVGEAGSGREALQLTADLDPDLVLLDVRMPGMDGIETARRMATACPRTVVVLISLEEPADLPSLAEAVGAVAHVRKQDLSPQRLQELWEEHGHRDHPA